MNISKCRNCGEKYNEDFFCDNSFYICKWCCGSARQTGKIEDVCLHHIVKKTFPKTTSRNTLSKTTELWQYKRNLIRPNIKVSKQTFLGGQTIQTIRFGTYLKPIARLIGTIAKYYGYQVRYRGRGERTTKHQNFDGDIRNQDALFLCVYGEKYL